MADLKTILGLDDKEFRQGLDAVSRRLTGFVNSSKGYSNLIRGVFKIGGVAGAIAGATELARKIHEIQEAAEGAGAAIHGMGQEIVNTLRPKGSSKSSLDQQISELRESVAQRKALLEKDANRQEMEMRVRDFNPLSKMAWQLVTGKNTDGQAAELRNAKDQELRRIEQFRQRKEVELRQEYRDKQLAELKQSMDEVSSRRTGRLRDLQNEFRDSQVLLLEQAGLEDEADSVRRRHALDTKLREIEDDRYLSREEKRAASGIYGRFDEIARSIDQRTNATGLRSGGTLSLAAGTGGAFGQQIAAINLPLADQTKKQTALQTKIAASLDEVARALGGGALVPTRQ